MRKRKMKERVIEVFFYGLFMDTEALHAKGLHPMHPRRAIVGDMDLLIGAKATLVKSAGRVAYGVVMRLSESEIAELYSEPSLSGYRAEPVVAICEDALLFQPAASTSPVPP
jgi:hypothetical protein